ncbi:hypothetical protein BLA29_003896 [Euroglyphus maynei]|uniref:Uncharacterized protein n=1 Tax=Euroglyphus maynei TaxID=6958 RepID=A0A1Y3B8D8_EURMA|nr:hypothetical protein BLA29_003896 [Euroglyphus maynei]
MESFMLGRIVFYNGAVKFNQIMIVANKMQFWNFHPIFYADIYKVRYVSLLSNVSSTQQHQELLLIFQKLWPIFVAILPHTDHGIYPEVPLGKY